MLTSNQKINCLKSISKYHINKKDLANIEMFSQNFDEEANEILLKNKIELLFIKHCKNNGLEENIPTIYWKNYSNSLFVLQFRYEEYLEQIQRITLEFEKQGIPYAILKGFSFIDALFCTNNIVYRHFADVDFLVPKSLLAKIHSILSGLNFIQGEIIGNSIINAKRCDLIYWSLNSHQVHEYTNFSKYSHISSFFRVNIDINTTIFEGGKIIPVIGTETLLENTISKSISSKVKINCLNYTYGLIQLCYHFYKDMHYKTKIESHDNYSLMKFCDLREYILMFRANINWEEFRNIIRKYNIEKKVLYPLYMVSSFYGDLGVDELFDDLIFDLDETSLCWEKLFL